MGPRRSTWHSLAALVAAAVVALLLQRLHTRSAPEPFPFTIEGLHPEMALGEALAILGPPARRTGHGFEVAWRVDGRPVRAFLCSCRHRDLEDLRGSRLELDGVVVAEAGDSLQDVATRLRAAVEDWRPRRAELLGHPCSVRGPRVRSTEADLVELSYDANDQNPVRRHCAGHFFWLRFREGRLAEVQAGVTTGLGVSRDPMRGGGSPGSLLAFQIPGPSCSASSSTLAPPAASASSRSKRSGS